MNLYDVYPKQFRNSKIPVERNRCFVLMPFDDKYNTLYDKIKQTLASKGILCKRDDEIPGPQPFMNKVLTEILKSRFIIVILTDYKPNVLYELGIAHCFKDVQNVLILVKKASDEGLNVHKFATDLSHLTYTEYNEDDFEPLKDDLIKFITNGNAILDFHDFLYEKELLPVITDNNSDFVNYLADKFSDSFDIFVDLLLKNTVNVKNCKPIVNKCKELLYEQIDCKSAYLDVILKMYAELLISVEKYGPYGEFVYDFMSDELIRPRGLTDNEKNQIKTDFAVYLAKQEKYLEILLPWIIQYFRRTKSSTIDLNRYKLESFLITVNFQEVNDAISNALRDKDFHVREHISDIIGEKKYRGAFDNLLAQLPNEPSLYAGKSMIVALGKLGIGHDTNAAIKIVEWLSNNLTNIRNSGRDFTNSILTKSKKAIENLDSHYVQEFNDRFNVYITNKDY